MVGGEGLEPSRPFDPEILNLRWLPITTPAHYSSLSMSFLKNPPMQPVRTRIKRNVYSLGSPRDAIQSAPQNMGAIPTSPSDTAFTSFGRRMNPR